MGKLIGPLTWAWVIIVGALMITPGGIQCIACGQIGSLAVGVISVVLGIAGITLNRQQTAGR